MADIKFMGKINLAKCGRGMVQISVRNAARCTFTAKGMIGQLTFKIPESLLRKFDSTESEMTANY